MRVFFDSSALVKRYVAEKGSEAVLDLCGQASSLGLSAICFPEIISALCRLRRERKLDEDAYQDAKLAIAQDLEDADVCPVGEGAVVRTVRLLESNVLRAMDALHIAAALEWEADLFVSADANQIKAAKGAGLKVRALG